MEAPSFWDHPEKARGVIGQLKPLNGLLGPFEELSSGIADLGALKELAAEDASLEADLEKELQTLEVKFGEFELRAMLSGPQDASNAFLRIQAGGGGTEACDWAQILLRMYTRWAERNGYELELIDELRNE